MSKSLYLIVTFLLFFIATLTCNAQVKKAPYLTSIYNAYSKDSSAKNMHAFFYAFPVTFENFQQIYGYDDKKGAAKYYNISEQHLSLFFRSANVVNIRTFSQKLLSISENGHWEADAVNYYQQKLRTYFFFQPQLFLQILAKRTPKQIISFWFFFSDGPHFDEELHKRVMVSLKDQGQMKVYYSRAVQQVKINNVH